MIICVTGLSAGSSLVNVNFVFRPLGALTCGEGIGEGVGKGVRRELAVAAMATLGCVGDTVGITGDRSGLGDVCSALAKTDGMVSFSLQSKNVNIAAPNEIKAAMAAINKVLFETFGVESPF
ncbi:hypothetical protein L0244_36890 [bacterium]|nr:hypothetical protein [bacterium]